ncbi:hypothetical protein [Mycoplasma feriruminatoris]|uniref:hypothetical protein n=1 Tax=Mycoplasma feriruminatoris TaxID=1179777 RepID=UPI0018A88216|nr:hypothetical protein [Mycoplasma feriruminatoris]
MQPITNIAKNKLTITLIIQKTGGSESKQNQIIRPYNPVEAKAIKQVTITLITLFSKK